MHTGYRQDTSSNGEVGVTKVPLRPPLAAEKSLRRWEKSNQGITESMPATGTSYHFSVGSGTAKAQQGPNVGEPLRPNQVTSRLIFGAFCTYLSTNFLLQWPAMTVEADSFVRLSLELRGLGEVEVAHFHRWHHHV